MTQYAYSQNYSRFTRTHIHASSTESNRASRCAGYPIQNSLSRCIQTRATQVEAFLRWSITRDMIRAGSSTSIILFTVIPNAVHVTLTQFKMDNFETRQWIFSPETDFNEVMTQLNMELIPDMHTYIFMPARSALRGLNNEHLGCSLTREFLKSEFPAASIIRVDNIARLAHHVMPRTIGADTHRWLNQLMNSTSRTNIQDATVSEFLSSAAKTDSAMLLRLLVTPTSAWM